MIRIRFLSTNRYSITHWNFSGWFDYTLQTQHPILETSCDFGYKIRLSQLFTWHWKIALFNFDYAPTNRQHQSRDIDIVQKLQLLLSLWQQFIKSNTTSLTQLFLYCSKMHTHVTFLNSCFAFSIFYANDNGNNVIMSYNIPTRPSNENYENLQPSHIGMQPEWRHSVKCIEFFWYANPIKKKSFWKISHIPPWYFYLPCRLVIEWPKFYYFPYYFDSTILTQLAEDFLTRLIVSKQGLPCFTRNFLLLFIGYCNKNIFEKEVISIIDDLAKSQGPFYNNTRFKSGGMVTFVP